jgi:hypothetical protein
LKKGGFVRDRTWVKGLSGKQTQSKKKKIQIKTNNNQQIFEVGQARGLGE